MADFCIFQKFVNDWNETAIKRYHDVSVVTGSEQLQLKAVLFKNQDVKWLLRCETIDWECLLHNCDPLLLLIHKDTKSSEVLSPNGDILLKRTSFTSVCTQQLDANSVFSQHKCTKWVEKHTLDRWDIQRNDDGSFTPIRVYGQHAKALEIPTVKEVKKSIANKNNKKNKKNF